MPVFLWPWPNFRKAGVKMFYMFFFLPILSTSRLIICHSCIHLQAITDAVMFVGTGIVLAVFSTITHCQACQNRDCAGCIQYNYRHCHCQACQNRDCVGCIQYNYPVRLVRTGTVLAAFSTITLSGLLEQGLCWLHSVQLHCQACRNRDCVGCIQYNYTVRLVGTGTVLAACSTITDTVRLVRTGIVLAAFSTITLSGLSEQGLCWLHSVQLHCQACRNRDCVGCMQYNYRHCQACQNRDCVGCIQYNYTVRLVGTGIVLAAFRQHGAARVCILLFTFFCYVCVCLYIYHLKLVTFFLLLFWTVLFVLQKHIEVYGTKTEYIVFAKEEKLICTV